MPGRQADRRERSFLGVFPSPRPEGVQRLGQVFNTDIETCQVCGGVLRLIACVEDPVVIEKILIHLAAKAAAAHGARRSAGRRLTGDAGSRELVVSSEEKRVYLVHEFGG
jgi:hypothetical protein